ncbi:MAG TPA: bifunctional nuclease family protein [Candidatus Thermoplasmatota archaeon]|nr:bifunctional nuclease family protein [Candidatus Thermoplasmatota archaeon]
MVDAGTNLPVKVESVLMSTQGPVVMLRPKDSDGQDRVLPIFIDQSQALNIQLALEGQLSPRPMTHDLFNNVLNELGAIVDKIVIEDLAQNTFYASLYIQVEKPGPNGEKVVKRFDARPSDCLALAVRVGAPIEVTQKLMDAASIKRSDVGPLPVEVSEDDDEDVDLGVER